MINIILGLADVDDYPNSDLNNDGIINVIDIVTTINIILCNSNQE